MKRSRNVAVDQNQSNGKMVTSSHISQVITRMKVTKIKRMLQRSLTIVLIKIRIKFKNEIGSMTKTKDLVKFSR